MAQRNQGAGQELRARNGDLIEEGDKVILWGDALGTGHNQDGRCAPVTSVDPAYNELRVRISTQDGHYEHVRVACDVASVDAKHTEARPDLA
jgi:hypothetical protein